MKKRSNIIGFGEQVDGYDSPVLNEREIRASAGILFLFMFVSLMLVEFQNNFLLIKYVITVFLTDLVVRVFINPKFSPTLIIGRLIVSRQVPEYVSAAQKKFAWKIGIALSGLMFLLIVIINSYSIITVVTCFFCLAFLFFESAFGICLGCILYGLFYRADTGGCAGEGCTPGQKQPMQKISWIQLIIVFGLIVYVGVILLFFDDYFHQTPRSLWNIKF